MPLGYRLYEVGPQVPIPGTEVAMVIPLVPRRSPRNEAAKVIPLVPRRSPGR